MRTQSICCAVCYVVLCSLFFTYLFILIFFLSGTESVSVAMDGMEPYLSPGEDSNDENMWTIEIADGSSTLDGEVGKRLNQMVPIPVSLGIV